jgi:Na+-transporting NADH:ubiquinone oxidoreductase subunit NqrF
MNKKVTRLGGGGVFITTRIDMFDEVHRYYGKRKMWLFLGRISQRR